MRAISLTVFLGVAMACSARPAADGAGGGTTEVDGTWRLAGYIEDGRPTRRKSRRTIGSSGPGDSGDARGRQVLQQAELQGRSAEDAQHIDFIDDKGAVVRGVYEFRGNELRMAILADPERQRTDRPGDLRRGKMFVDCI